MLRLCQPQISAKGSPGEDELEWWGAVGPDSEWRAHQAGERAAPSEGAPAGACQGDLRKELRLGDSDFGVRRDQDLFRLTNVRPPLDERGRQARRHFGRKWLLHQRASAWHGLRVVAQENSDGIFFLRDLPLQIS